METDQNKEREIISKVETALQELKDDVSFAIKINANLTSDIEAFLSRMDNKYSESIKNIALGDVDTGNSELNEILGGIYETRLQFYKRLCYNYLTSLREDISNMLWLKNRFSFSDKIDTIDKELIEASKILVQKDLAIESFKDKIISLSDLKNKLETERKEIRSHLFWTTIIWGIPILLGLYISDKYAQYTVYGFLLVLMVSILLYAISGSGSSQKFIIRNKMPLTGTFLFVSLIVFAISYISYTGLLVSENMSLSLEKIFGFIAPIMILIVVVLTSFSRDIQPYLKKKKLDIKIDITNKQFKSGDEIPLNLTLKNNGSKIMTNISTTVIATGLLLESVESTKIRALGIGDTKKGVSTIKIPRNSPNGDYIIQFKTSFYIATEFFKKENKLTVSVIK